MEHDDAAAAWAAPAHRLYRVPFEPPAPMHAKDGSVTLRLPVESDIPVVARHAPGSAAHGIWLPVGQLDVAAATWAAWFVRELRIGWTLFGGRYGGGLFADAGATKVAAYLNFVPLRPGVVELSYGVAPEARGLGVASTSADVAAAWALSAGYERVELHISATHAESQRVAAKAGFTFSHEMTKRVEATGAEYGDLIYARTRHTS